MLTHKIEEDSIVFYNGAAVILTVREMETQNGVVLEITGELRSDTAHDLQDELIALATVGAEVVVDFKEVTYVAPTIQHVFLRVQQKMDVIGKGTLKLVNLSAEIYREFEMTGVSELLLIER